MSYDQPFTKDNVDRYLKELAKEFRKRNGNKVPAELILIGGAAVLINYGFREMTYDMDAIIMSSSVMKDAINAVGDRLGLPYGWLNTDFTKTNSFSPALLKYSKYYKTFSNILQVRTISAEYLIVMKLVAGRVYKNDLSDIIGILIEQRKRNEDISLEKIQQAAVNLYGSYDIVPENSKKFIESVFQQENLLEFYQQYRTMEIENKDILVKFQSDYPNVLNGDNLTDIIAAARKKKEESIRKKE